MSSATEKLHFLIVLIIQKSIFGVQNKKNSFDFFFNTSFQYIFLFQHFQIFKDAQGFCSINLTTIMFFFKLKLIFIAKFTKKHFFHLHLFFDKFLLSFPFEYFQKYSRSQSNTVSKTDINILQSDFDYAT